MDYRVYRLSVKEILVGTFLYIFLAAAIAFFFYRSALIFFILWVGFVPFMKIYKKELNEIRKKQLLVEFSETLCSVSVNMKAGMSLENAFSEAYKDIVLFFGDDSLMGREILRIQKGLGINITLEELIEDFAKRSKEENIKMFSDVCKSAKRNGGNITEVLSNTADRIREKICVDAEIETIITEKKLELRIMEGMPFLIMLYLEATSARYFDVLYEGMRGRLIMTAALFIYVAASAIGNKMTKISL